MRDIKFRAWDGKYDKKMIYFDIFSVPEETDFGQPLHELPIMQYTGLKDMNGKEIYEGDIVRYKYACATKQWWRHIEEIGQIEKEFDEQRKRYSIRYGVVEFRLGMWVVRNSLDWITGDYIAMNEKIKFSRGYLADYEERWFDFEVVGNIYENPELVEKVI